ncbi:recombinase family protein [Streptomyces sp. DSM 44917]|uniref:Recombinase family protein n=1 Tax=Streptomyces boetiae TaxID=3075541 RepID=A0ABU2L6M7_9ACTN|nr:recombinase family protein [Streptomyces sp. DSM 44917]MDT0307209.1 recombinase family protein [Streptomyces sp. DSM 44917]
MTDRSSTIKEQRHPVPPAGGGTEALPLRAAFYGSLGGNGDAGALAQQFRCCQQICAGRAAITRYFYDIASPVGWAAEERIRECFGPPRRHGGWPELAELLAEQPKPVDIVVCYSLDRIARPLARLRERGRQLARYSVPVVIAQDGWEEIPPSAWTTGRHEALMPLTAWASPGGDPRGIRGRGTGA